MTAGKRGARLVEHDLSSIHLHNFHDSATLPALPTVWDLSPAGPANDPLGNDAVGDCVEVAIQVLRMFGAWLGSLNQDGTPEYLTGFRRAHTPYTLRLYYKTGIAEGGQPPEPDNGLDPYFALMWMHKHGHIEAFAALDKTQPTFSTYARQIAVEFDGLLLALELDASAETEFNQNEPWGTLSAVPDPQMGHAVAYCAFDQSQAVQDSVWTWGRKQGMTTPFDDACVHSLFAVFTNEQFRAAGGNAEALQAAITALPGYDKIPFVAGDVADEVEVAPEPTEPEAVEVAEPVVEPVEVAPAEPVEAAEPTTSDETPAPEHEDSVTISGEALQDETSGDVSASPDPLFPEHISGAAEELRKIVAKVLNACESPTGRALIVTAIKDLLNTYL